MPSKCSEEHKNKWKMENYKELLELKCVIVDCALITIFRCNLEEFTVLVVMEINFIYNFALHLL